MSVMAMTKDDMPLSVALARRAISVRRFWP